jgi:5S rRNA maturation endonuclease (ribonuclease M5)
MRVKSDRGTKNDGWLHVLKQRPVVFQKIRRIPQKQETAPTVDFNAMIAEWQAETAKSEMSVLALSLGVSVEALNRIGACYSRRYGAWAFPMKDGQNNIIGIRLRYADGRKLAVKGSKAGIFYGHFDNPDYVLICEGPTDTAAALTAGFSAIGRPSCRGQEIYILQLLKIHWNAKVAIVADNDLPGIEGANKLAKELKRPVRIIIPPAKDIREWVRTGAGRCEIISACENAAILNLR